MDGLRRPLKKIRVNYCTLVFWHPFSWRQLSFARYAQDPVELVATKARRKMPAGFCSLLLFLEHCKLETEMPKLKRISSHSAGLFLSRHGPLWHTFLLFGVWPRAPRTGSLAYRTLSPILMRPDTRLGRSWRMCHLKLSEEKGSKTEHKEPKRNHLTAEATNEISKKEHKSPARPVKSEAKKSKRTS